MAAEQGGPDGELGLKVFKCNAHKKGLDIPAGNTNNPGIGPIRLRISKRFCIQIKRFSSIGLNKHGLRSILRAVFLDGAFQLFSPGGVHRSQKALGDKNQGEEREKTD